jgi:hypothetical protein
MAMTDDRKDAHALLEARLAWEREHPRPETLVRAEKTIVQALNAAGFGRQYQVTRENGFEIAVDDLIIRVERDPWWATEASVGQQ